VGRAPGVGTLAAQHPDPAVPGVLLGRAGSQWQRWSSIRNIVLPVGTSTGGPAGPVGVTGPGNAYVYANYITRGYFSLVALNFTDTATLDRDIAADLRRNHHYRIVQVIPYGTEVPPSAWAPTSSGNTSRAPDRASSRLGGQVGSGARQV